ncbi:hypothetical protein EsH8_II_000003 [Colletotrichum jinshuiense]
MPPKRTPAKGKGKGKARAITAPVASGAAASSAASNADDAASTAPSTPNSSTRDTQSLVLGASNTQPARDKPLPPVKRKHEQYEFFGFPDSQFKHSSDWTKGSNADKGSRYNFNFKDIREDKPWIRDCRPRWHNDDWSVACHDNEPEPSKGQYLAALKAIEEAKYPERVTVGKLLTYLDTFCGQVLSTVGSLYYDGWTTTDSAEQTASISQILNYLDQSIDTTPYLRLILADDTPGQKVITKAMVAGESPYAGTDEGGNTDVIGTMLFAASQILKFSPTRQLDPDVALSADPAAYEHRFKREDLPENIVGYCLEDWCRAVCIVAFFCYRRTGRTNIGLETAPKQNFVQRVFFVNNALTENFVTEEQAKTSTDNMLNRAMFQMSVPVSKAKKRLARMLQERDAAAISNAELSLRQENLVSAMQGGTNISEFINDRCAALDAPGLAKMDDNTLEALIEAAKARVEQPDEPGTRTAYTLLQTNPEIQEADFQDFLSVGCGDISTLAEETRNMPESAPDRMKAAVQVHRAYETFTLNTSISSDEPKEDEDDLELEAKLQGYDDWRNMQPNKRMPDYKLIAHQAVDIGWAFRMESSPFHGCILANGVGTGKTNIFFGLIHAAACDIDRKIEADPEAPRGPFYPTLLAVQMANFSQIWEKSKVYDDKLTIRLFYSHRNNLTKADGRKAATINADELEKYLLSLDPTDPKTARIVVITTLTTALNRLLDYELSTVRLHDRDAAQNFKGCASGVSPHPNGKKRKLPLKGGVPVVSDKYFDPDDYEEVMEKSKADAWVGTWKLRHHLSHFQRKWARIIIDEAHMGKKDEGRMFQFLLREWSPALHFVTATPMINHIRDLVVFIKLLYSRIWYGVPVSDHWVVPPAKELGDTPLLYHDAYDPNQEFYEVGNRSVKGIFHPDTYDEPDGELPPGVAFMKRHYDDTGARLWLLHPGIFKTTGSSCSWRDEFAQICVPAVIRMIQRRRQMHTRMRLPDGSICYPGSNMKPYSFSIEELSYPDKEAKQVMDHSQGLLARKIMTGSTKKKAARNNEIPTGGGAVSGGTSLADRASAGNAENNDDGAASNTTMREGMLVSFDLHNIVLQGDNDPDDDAQDSNLLRFIPEDVIADAIKEHGEKMPASASDDVDPRPRSPERQPLDQEDLMVELGREHVEYLIRKDPFGGLLHIFEMVNKDPDLPTPYNAFQLLKWLLSKSPILVRVLEIAYKTIRCGDKRRLFILADIPWQQQVIAAMLAIAGFNVESVRSCHSESERNAAVQRFTDPRSTVNVFISNTNISLVGLDLHEQCSVGIFVSISWSINLHIQGGGRLIRLGQKHEVEWYMLKVKNSYYDYMERNMVSKWADELLGCSRVPSHIQGWVRYACVFEIIRNFLHQPFNRLSWCDTTLPSAQISEYHAPSTVQRGHFYTFVAIWARRLTPAEYARTFATMQFRLPSVAMSYYHHFSEECPKPMTYEEIIASNSAVKVETGFVDASVKLEEQTRDELEGSGLSRWQVAFEMRVRSRNAAANYLAGVEEDDEDDEDDEYNPDTFRPHMSFVEHLAHMKKELDEDDGTLHGHEAAAPPSHDREEAAPPPSPCAGRGGEAPPRETNDSGESQRSEFHDSDAINAMDSLVQAPVTGDKRPSDEGNVELPPGFPNKRARVQSPATRDADAPMFESHCDADDRVGYTRAPTPILEDVDAPMFQGQPNPADDYIGNLELPQTGADEHATPPPTLEAIDTSNVEEHPEAANAETGSAREPSQSADDNAEADTTNAPEDDHVGDVGDVSDLGDVSEDEEIEDEESEDEEIEDEEIEDEEIEDEEGQGSDYEESKDAGEEDEPVKKRPSRKAAVKAKAAVKRYSGGKR